MVDTKLFEYVITHRVTSGLEINTGILAKCKLKISFWGKLRVALQVTRNFLRVRILPNIPNWAPGFSPGFFEGATPKGEGAGGGGTPSCMRNFLKYEDEMVLPGWFQINVLEWNYSDDLDFVKLTFMINVKRFLSFSQFMDVGILCPLFTSNTQYHYK